MAPSDAYLPDEEPRDAVGDPGQHDGDAVEGLARIVSRGDAAVTVLMEGLEGSLSGPFEVRPIPDAEQIAWAEHLVDALGEVRGRIVAVTAQRPGVAARVALAIAASISAAGSPATIVDGSIEEPLFSKGLPDDGDEGLVDAVLFGVSSSTIARRTLLHDVRLVTAGSYPISVPAVFGADAYETTLQKLAREDATVILVIPASYAPVAGCPAAQLVIVGEDLPGLDRLTRELRGIEDLREARFVAVLSAPESSRIPTPAATPSEAAGAEAKSQSTSEEEVKAGEPSDGAMPEGEAPVPEPVVEKAPDSEPLEQAVEEGTDEKGLEDALEAEPDEEVHEDALEAEPDEKVREDALDGEPDAEDLEPALDEASAVGSSDAGGQETGRRPAVVTAGVAGGSGGESGGRRWGVLITVAVILIAAGVAWRSGLFDPLLPGRNTGDAGTTGTAVRGETPEPPAQDATAAGDETPGDRSDRGDLAARDAEAGPGTSPTGESEGGSVSEPAEAQSWRARATLPAVPGQYVVFTSSHRRVAAAERDAGRLEASGFPSAVVDVDVPDRGRWHRVAVDAGFRALDDTRELLDIMKEVGYEGAWIERLRRPAPPEQVEVEPQPVTEPVAEPAESSGQAPADTVQRWIDDTDVTE